MTDVDIRKATEADLPAILRLHAHLVTSAEHALSVSQARQIFERMSTYPQYAVYVAVAREEIVGTFALLVMDNLAHMGAPSAIVEDVVVDERWQRQGIGKAMMILAMDLARNLGCYKLVLSSNRGREQAHAFYRSLGFEQHGVSFHVELSESL